MNLIYNDGTDAQLWSYRDSWEQSLNGELLLPDYIPESARILYVCGELRMEPCEQNGAELTVRGACCCTVLTEDGEGKLCALKQSIPFESVRSCPEGVTPAVYGQLSECGCRMVSPRKAQLRCKASFTGEGWENRSLLPVLEGASGEQVEYDCVEDSAAFCRILTGREIPFSEDVELESAMGEAEEILCATLSLYVNDFHPSGGGLDFSGEALLRVLYADPEGKPFLLTRRLPLSGNLVGEAEIAGGECVGWGEAGEVRVSVQNNSYGERRVLEVDFTYDVTVLCCENRPIQLVRDLYCIGASCSIETGVLPLMRCRRGMNTNFSVNLSKSREELAAQDAQEILLSGVTLSAPVWSVDDAKCVMECSADVKMVAKTADGACMPLSFTAPVRFSCDGADARALCTVLTPVNVRARLDSGGVYCDFEVMTGVMQMIDSPQSAVTAAEIHSGGESGPQTPIMLYYPQRGQRLWEIAKRYGTTVEAVAAANHITGDAVGSERVLLIPRRKAKSIVI